MDLKELENGIDPSVHWYYQSKKKPLEVYFKSLVAQQDKPIKVIDFGSGSGFFAFELLNTFPNQISEVWQVDIGYTEEEMANTGHPKVKKMHFLPEGVKDAVIIMMDVLEHIESDYDILDEIVSKCESNVNYFITVPAFMSLWSGHDLYMEHYRRYTLKTLRKLLNSQNCKASSDYYIYGWIFPIVWLVRKFNKADLDKPPEHSDMKPLPGFVNGILKHINYFEMNFRKANKLFGVTCVSEGKIV